MAPSAEPDLSHHRESPAYLFANKEWLSSRLRPVYTIGIIVFGYRLWLDPLIESFDPTAFSPVCVEFVCPQFILQIVSQLTDTGVNLLSAG